jgi:hypothetical protein
VRSNLSRCPPRRTLAALVSAFGATVAAKFSTGAGEPEDHLRGPLETLVAGLAKLSGLRDVVLAGEDHLAEVRVRPDFAVYVRSALAGFIEVKAPGKGAIPGRYRDRHDREQWERLSSLPNLLYTDGNSWGLYRGGEPKGEVVSLVGDVDTAGRAWPSRTTASWASSKTSSYNRPLRRARRASWR